MDKISKTIFGLVMTTLMIALPMTAAMGATGISYSRDTYENSGYELFPCFNDCEHTHLGYNDNMMVGFGLYAYYDTNILYPAYCHCNWWFSTQAGWSSTTYDDSPVRQMPPMGCIFDVDFGLESAYHSTWYDSSYGTWTTGYTYNGNWEDFPDGHHANIVSDQFDEDLYGDRISVEGMTQGIFFYKQNPWTIYYYYAQTQIPPGHWAPVQSYAFYTAHFYSQYGDWGYDT